MAREAKSGIISGNYTHCRIPELSSSHIPLFHLVLNEITKDLTQGLGHSRCSVMASWAITLGCVGLWLKTETVELYSLYSKPSAIAYMLCGLDVVI